MKKFASSIRRSVESHLSITLPTLLYVYVNTVEKRAAHFFTLHKPLRGSRTRAARSSTHHAALRTHRSEIKTQIDKYPHQSNSLNFHYRERTSSGQTLLRSILYKVLQCVGTIKILSLVSVQCLWNFIFGTHLFAVDEENELPVGADLDVTHLTSLQRLHCRCRATRSLLRRRSRRRAREEGISRSPAPPLSHHAPEAAAAALAKRQLHAQK